MTKKNLGRSFEWPFLYLHYLGYNRDMEYHTPKHRQRFELEIKRSQFITTIDHIQSKDAAKQLLSELRTEFPDANHHCWAYILGKPSDTLGQDQSDDGEPKNTAGKPMLNVLQHSGLGHVMAVTTRYFGGIKLGAGGLVRAYSQSVSEALKQLETIEFLELEQAKVELPYSLLETLKHRLQETRAKIIAEEFSDAVELKLEFPSADQEQVIKQISDIGYGKIKITLAQSLSSDN